MIRTILLLLLSIFSVSACSDCSIKEGAFETAGGSESATTLQLLPGKQFILQHESWQPGNYEKHITRKDHGTWKCNNAKITLYMNDKEFTADIQHAGNNPVGIPPQTLTLHFKQNTNIGLTYLSNTILYQSSTANR